MIIEYDKTGRVMAKYKSQKEAAERNGVTKSAIDYSCRHPGHIIKSIGRYFEYIKNGEKQQKRANCGACFYSFTPGGTGNCFCDYYLITGQRRPCKGSECEIWRDHPKPERKPWQKTSVKHAPMTREQAAELTSIIMGKGNGNDKGKA